MKPSSRAATGLGLAIAAAIVPSNRSLAGVVDATSGASIQVLGGSTTDTSANVIWRMVKRSGEGVCVINLKTPYAQAISVPASVRTAEATSANFTFGGLLPGTTYTFTINVRGGGGSAKSNVATMITNGKTSSIVAPIPYNAARPSVGYDAFGRRLGRIPQSGVAYSPQGALLRFVGQSP
jgi:hypothetical protein